MLLPKACVVVMALLSSAAMAADTDPQSFCQRFAPKLGLERDKAPVGSSVQSRQWHVSLIGLGGFLFGGHAIASFGIGPLDGGTGDAPPSNSCDMTRKGALCRIEGPAALRVGTKKGKVTEGAVAGEQAEVEMRGTTIYCRDL